MPPGNSSSAALQIEQKDILLFSKFDGMDTQSDRHDLREDKAAWMENLQPIGPNRLLCVPAPAAAISNLSGEVITEQYFAPINGIDYMINFCSSGAAYAVKISDGSQTKFANSGTFSTVPDMTVWNLSRILIADATSGYSTWDGTLFVKSGGVSPNILITAGGSGYTTGATVAISGGSGSGATATVQVTAGVVTGITLTNAGTGYKAGDTLTFTISPVGSGSGATATGHIWPFVTPNPTTLAVYQGRVWLAQKNVINYTGTGASYGGVGYDDFLTADAAGSFTITDADLVHSITALRALNNYLFIVGDNSVKQIGNITVSGTTTSFTTVTLSSDQGTSFKNTIISYNRLVLFANTVGVYAVFGTSVEKISDEMDGIFRLIDFTSKPSAAVNDVNNIHCFLLRVKYNDPATGTARSIILSFMNKKWFVISQGNNLAYIATVEIGGVTETFGTSGSDITQILENSQAAVDIKLQTSLTSREAPYISKNTVRYAIAQNASATNAMNLLIETERSSENIAYTVTNGITFIGGDGNPLIFIGSGSVPINFFTSSVFQYLTGNTKGTSGVYIGATLTGSVVGFSFNSLMIEYGVGAAFTATSVMVQQ